MHQRELLLGLAPTRRFVFSAEDAARYKKRIEQKLTEWQVDFVSIDPVNKEGLLFGRRDAAAAAELFKKAQVDAVFAPHVNFGTEEVVAQTFLGTHFVIPPHRPGTGNFEIRGGQITIGRFDGIGGDYSLLMGHARGVPGPYTLGTYLWAEVPDWSLWEERVIRGPYIHHVGGVHGLFAPALYEATRYIPGLKPDPVQPTESELQTFMRSP